jgi:serine/threonine-protein kinase
VPIAEDQGLHYFAMEYITGTSLQRLLRDRGKMDARQAARLILQTSAGLGAAHEADVIHRDIKPANILITTDGRVKVSDFGVAKAVGEATELTRTGMLVGSPAYMAPEQIKGLELDGRADLFSLGVVLYEMLLRRKPFPADTVTTLVYQILHEDPLADPAISTALPREQAALLRACLAKEVAARLPDGRTFAARCREVVAAGTARTAAVEPPTRVMAIPPVPPPPPPARPAPAAPPAIS